MILFVGDRPSPRMKPGAKPFEGAACEKRLMEWLEVLSNGFTNSAFDDFRIVNRFDRPKRIFAKWWTGEAIVVALGNNASRTLNKYCIVHFKLPHPSGRNRQINDKAFIEQKLKECKEWLQCRT